MFVWTWSRRCCRVSNTHTLRSAAQMSLSDRFPVFRDETEAVCCRTLPSRFVRTRKQCCCHVLMTHSPGTVSQVNTSSLSHRTSPPLYHSTAAEYASYRIQQIQHDAIGSCHSDLLLYAVCFFLPADSFRHGHLHPPLLAVLTQRAYLPSRNDIGQYISYNGATFS